MNRPILKILAPALLFPALLCYATSAAAIVPAPVMATGDFTTATGAPAGKAVIVVAKGAPVLRINVSGLPAGVHGVHIHTTGKCEGPGFTTAGGHLNPAGHQHGKDNPAGSHLGDLPNVTVGEHGNGDLAFDLPLDIAALRTALFDADGAAVVVHAAPDDYRTDPSGNSGARIACAVLKPS